MHKRGRARLRRAMAKPGTLRAALVRAACRSAPPGLHVLSSVVPERGPKARVNALRRSAGTTRACAYARSRHRLLQVLIDLVEETGSGEPFLIGAHEQREVLGHKARLDGADRDFLQGRSEFRELGVVVELGAMCEPARPGEDRGDRIGGGLLPPLVLRIEPRHL